MNSEWTQSSELASRRTVLFAPNSAHDVMSVLRAGEERRARKRGPRRVRSGYSQAYRESSSSHAFRSDRQETVVDALAVLRARAIGKVVGLCYDIRSALLRRLCIHRVDTRCFVKLLLQALSGHVGAGWAFSLHRSRPRLSPAFFVPPRRDNVGWTHTPLWL